MKVAIYGLCKALGGKMRQLSVFQTSRFANFWLKFPDSLLFCTLQNIEFCVKVL